MVSREAYRDEIRGCIFGGAVGDALGYPVEFLDWVGICADYGLYGITEYDSANRIGKALISDDTQMTLFTAGGYLVYETALAAGERDVSLSGCIARAYGDWYITQTQTYPGSGFEKNSWLRDLPELYNLRAPGITCLRALGTDGRTKERDFIRNSINHSKGCGGVMRVAPLAVVPWEDIRRLDQEAAQAAAVTHSHPLGYLPAAALCHILNRIIYRTDYPIRLLPIIREAIETVCDIYQGTEYVEQFADIMDLAVNLAANDEADLINIRSLGGGWVAEEALAISVYCALRHEGDFSRGIIAAVNHDGDSDSTGAITGNILGALVGYQAIAPMWKERLEMADEILEIADDLCFGCPGKDDPNWLRKYGHGEWE